MVVWRQARWGLWALIVFGSCSKSPEPATPLAASSPPSTIAAAAPAPPAPDPAPASAAGPPPAPSIADSPVVPAPSPVEPTDPAPAKPRAGGTPPSRTRFDMILSVKEHEMHHRGQLMVIERLIGIVPHLTRHMQERMAATAAKK